MAGRLMGSQCLVHSRRPLRRSCRFRARSGAAGAPARRAARVPGLGFRRGSVADETMQPKEGFREAEPRPGARGEQVGDPPVGHHAVVAGLRGPGDDGFAKCPASAEARRMRDDSGEGEETCVIGPGQGRVVLDSSRVQPMLEPMTTPSNSATNVT